MLRFVHKYILMVQIHISKSITRVQKILASTFKLALKKKKNFELPSPCTLLVSGVVQLSEHEVRKLVLFKSLHAEKEGEELFC